MEVVVAVVLDMVLTGVVVDGRNCGWKAVRESYFLPWDLEDDDECTDRKSQLAGRQVYMIIC